jgi:hypothetical protein
MTNYRGIIFLAVSLIMAARYPVPAAEGERAGKGVAAESLQFKEELAKILKQ